MVMGPGPRVVPLSVVLNGDSALGLAAATTSANFTFVDEPCEGVITLDKPSGAFTDGVDGEGEYGIYEGVHRDCTWVVDPAGLPEGAIVSLNFNLIRLTAALGDRVRVTAGAAAGGETLREFPVGSFENNTEYSNVSVFECTWHDPACKGNASLVAPPPLRIQFIAGARGRGDAPARLGATYLSLGAVAQPNAPAAKAFRRVVIDTLGDSKAAHEPLSVQEAAAWESDARDDAAWARHGVGRPETWEADGGGAEAVPFELGGRPLTPEGWAARVLREGQEAQGLGRASAERLPPFLEE